MAPRKALFAKRTECVIKKSISHRISKDKRNYFNAPLNYLKSSTKNFISHSYSIIKKFNATVLGFLSNWSEVLDFIFSPGSRKDIIQGIIPNNTDLQKRFEELIERCRLVDVGNHDQNFFVRTEIKKTARYHATQIWNWKKGVQAHMRKKSLNYITKCIVKTFNAMDAQDLEIINWLIQDRYAFDSVDEVLQSSNALEMLFAKIGRLTYMHIFLDVIQTWFLIMPILQELSMYVSWEYLRNVRAHLLEVDQLYDALLSVFYKDDDVHSNKNKKHV